MLDGAYRWHLIRALGMPGVDGSIVKWFGTATDVEDQRTAREAAEAANRANAIHLGHHAVEEYRVGLPGGDAVEGLAAVPRARDLVPEPFEDLAQVAADLQLVVHDEHV